jgi:hypothetical protein
MTQVTSHDTGQHCHCVTFHRPKVMELDKHHIWPTGDGGPDVPENLIWLCPTTHRNVHEYLRLLLKYEGEVPSTAPSYPRFTREVAWKGYRRIKAKALVD